MRSPVPFSGVPKFSLNRLKISPPNIIMSLALPKNMRCICSASFTAWVLALVGFRNVSLPQSVWRSDAARYNGLQKSFLSVAQFERSPDDVLSFVCLWLLCVAVEKLHGGTDVNVRSDAFGVLSVVSFPRCRSFYKVLDECVPARFPYARFEMSFVRCVQAEDSSQRGLDLHILIGTRDFDTVINPWTGPAVKSGVPLAYLFISS